ncbi:hypothetical protein D3C72_2270980 [compost metagenome]
MSLSLTGWPPSPISIGGTRASGVLQAVSAAAAIRPAVAVLESFIVAAVLVHLRRV